MKILNRNILMIIYVLCISSSILYKANGIFYYAYGLSLLLFIILMFIGNDFKLIVKKNLKSILVLLTIFCLYCIITIFTNLNESFEIIKNVAIQFIFFVALIEMASYFSIINKRMKMIKLTYVAVSLPMIVLFFINFTNIDYFSSIINFFDTANRERYSFGIGDNNDAGLISCTLLILDFIIIKGMKIEKKNRKKFLWLAYIVLSTFVAVLIFIAASSRNAFLSLLIFVSMNILLRIGGKRENKIKYIFKFIFILIVGIIILNILMKYYKVDNISELFEYSGRMIAFYILDLIFQMNKYIFGLGYTSKTFRINSFIERGELYAVDSSYIYFIVQCGIIGMAIVCVTLFTIAKKIFKIKSKDVYYKYIIISLFFTLLFTGIFETTILYAGMPIGLVFTVIIFEFIASYSLGGKTNEIAKKEKCY